jgi:hypothetical protein
MHIDDGPGGQPRVMRLSKPIVVVVAINFIFNVAFSSRRPLVFFFYQFFALGESGLDRTEHAVVLL